ncbi:MAG: hypothetical protein IPJ19_08780 [Planctomycetes bacterium]|nr:hypothetical protein [Planctomycetota bacterium]
MSAPSADPQQTARRESALGVVGIAGGLLLILGIFLWLWTSRGREIDASEQFRASFAVQGVPEGWSVAFAQAVPDGLFDLHTEQRIVRLVRAGAAPDSDPVPAESAKPDWKKLPESAPLGEPARLYFAWYDPSSGSKDVEAQLDSHRAQPLEMLGEKGGIVRVDAGRVPWAGYDADFVQERLFDKGSFRDALRINLSTKGQFCVLNVLWRWGERGSRESAAQALALFPPPAR